MSILEDIKALQFSDKPAAEALLLSFMRDTLQLDVTQVELRPLAVSLNSFNGFLTQWDGKRLFFKTHTEPDTVIGEYYHAATLAQAGYPVIQPVYRSAEVGKQLLVYEVIDDPSVFDVAWAIENGDDREFETLTKAQQAADDSLLGIYRQTLTAQSADESARQPIHQLFYHRLVGGRTARFYGSVPDVPSNVDDAPYLDARRVKWVINGQRYDETIDDLIVAAIARLNPEREGVSIVGHGDAHNGNVFYRTQDDTRHLVYFDPAFAGNHHPLLDLTKPLFHNVFAMWMYFPNEKAQQTHLNIDKQGDTWHITHDYHVHPVRKMFLESKVERVLIPILRDLKANGQLVEDWRRWLKLALFCCPFLTMNLTDGEKFPPSIQLLGLSMAVEMGSESYAQRSLIDQTLDEVEKALQA